MPIKSLTFIIIFTLSLAACKTTQSTIESNSTAAKINKRDYKEYVKYFEEVYKTMDENYYQPVSRDLYNEFLQQFTDKIYAQLKGEKKSDNYVRWRSASLMIQKLKMPEDIFSELYPPEPAKEYEQTALGVRVDLGITGEKVDEGYKVTFIEPRSDAYEKGLREEDLITHVDQKELKIYKNEEIVQLLNPLENTTTKITYLDMPEKISKDIDVVTKEFFKQTVFTKPLPYPGIYYLKIERFNQKTSEDLFRFIKFFREQSQILGLVLDLRDNPGGPPLAAREISAFFLPSGEEFAYFQKKGQPKAILDVPAIPEELKYLGPIAILINKGSGSASELFSGILQRRGRAVLLGTNSAGQVLLKSMFHLKDGSMVLLVTSRGHHPDGMPFSFGGLNPDRPITEAENIDVLDYAAKYLIYVNIKDKKISVPSIAP